MLVVRTMSRFTCKRLWLLVGVCAAPHVVRAQPLVGGQVSLGGGVTQFTDQTLRDTTSPAGGMH